MTKGMRKDFRREIKNSFSRFLSITLIVVLGVAFFSGLRASKPGMEASADYQYDKENLMDIRIAGTLGVTEGDVTALTGVEGVADAEGVYERDFLCATQDAEVVAKAISLTDRINLIKVTEGRYPEKYNECIADREFLNKTGYAVGDTIKLSVGTDEKMDKFLATDEFTIVGVGSTSYFLSQDRGTASIGNGKVGGFVVLPKEAFTMPCFTQIFVTAKDAMALQTYSKEYEELIDRIQEKIKTIEIERCDIRYGEYQEEVESYILDARIKYEGEKEKAYEELANANQQLIDADTAIQEGKAELESKKMELGNAQAILNGSEEDLQEMVESIDTAKQELPKIEAECDTLRKQIDNANTEIRNMEAYLKAHENELSQEEYLDRKMALLSAKSTVQFYNNRLKEMESKIENGKMQIEMAEAFVEHGDEMIADAKLQIETAPAVIAEAEKKLEDAQIELDRSKEDYELAQQDVVDELAAAEEKLEKSEEEIRNVEKPTWYILDRESIASYVGYRNDANGLGSIGAVFPVIFFLVAALVSLTTMTRMVEEERTQIGTLKALGYSKRSIAAKYVLYALLSSFIGSILGVAIGESTIPAIAIHSYKIVYAYLRYTIVPFDVIDGVIALGLAVLCTTGAAWAACYRSMRSHPALLMRPEAPKAGKRIFLEKMGFIWKRLNFTQKAAARNLFRYKKRLFMTIFGVAGCMALLLVGFGLNDSIGAMSKNQFHKVWQYQGEVGIDETSSRAEKRQMLSELSGMPGISEYLQTNRSITFAKSETDEEGAYIIVPQDTSRMADYVRLTSRNGKNTYAMSDDGVIITEKLAKVLGVGIGDTIQFKEEETGTPTQEIAVSGIIENYFYHYIYMTPNVYKTLFGEQATLNSIMIKTDGSVDDETLAKNILDLVSTNSVAMNSTTENTINSVMHSMLIIVFILILSAGLLAFVVLYNLNNINITERRRELATLKVLGFYDKELAAYVYRENIVLTIFGMIFGILFGIVLHAYVMNTVETDIIMFGKEIRFWSYLASILLTAGFSALVNWVMFYKLRKVDMVESLKSAE